MVIDTIVGKDIHIDTLGDAMEIVHEACKIIVWDGDVRSRAIDVRFRLARRETHFLIGCARCLFQGIWKVVVVVEGDGRNCGFRPSGGKGLYRQS